MQIMQKKQKNKTKNNIKDKLKDMTWQEHLYDFRKRIIYSSIFFLIAFILCYVFKEKIYNILISPLAKTKLTEKMIYTSLTEGFLTYVKLSFFSAFLISFPVILHQIWQFISPGLYKNEKKTIIPMLIFSITLFILSILLVYFFIMPKAWEFLLSYQTTNEETALPIILQAKISEYLSLNITLITGFAIASQFPVILLLLIKLNILKISSLEKKRKYYIVFAFFIAAVLTPPDVLTQIILAAFLIFLYELIIIYTKTINNKN